MLDLGGAFLIGGPCTFQTLGPTSLPLVMSKMKDLSKARDIEERALVSANRAKLVRGGKSDSLELAFRGADQEVNGKDRSARLRANSSRRKGLIKRGMEGSTPSISA